MRGQIGRVRSGLTPGLKSGLDAAGRPVTKPRERLEYLIAELDKAGTKVAIPTPVLSEVLVRADATASQAIIETLNKQAIFSIESFDQRAAIEVAVMLRDKLKGGKKALKEGKRTPCKSLPSLWRTLW